MSYDFNFDGILNYDDDQAVSPDTVIAELGNQLEKATNGFIKGVVREYNGPIESYDQMSAFASIASALGTSLVHRDIQDNLGEIGYQEYKFEFFLTTSKLEDYKYRVLFLNMVLGCIQLKLYLNRGLQMKYLKKKMRIM